MMSVRMLALDTTMDACSVALLADDQLALRLEQTPQQHTQRILPMIADTLTEHQLTLSDLDVLAFSRGPGSFTGVRVGVSITQGLALGANLPVIGISTLMMLAQGAWRQMRATRVLVAVDARMGEVYWAEYQRDSEGNWQGEQTEAVITPDAAIVRMQSLTGCWVMVGTGWQVWPVLQQHSSLQLTPGDLTYPDAQDLLPLAWTRWQAGQTVTAEQAQPVYLRNEVAWQKMPASLSDKVK